MLPGLVSAIKRFFRIRDELSLRNIRRDQWPLLLIFPLSVILGDFRYFNLHIEFGGLQSYEWMLYPLGLGWLVLAFIPKRLVPSFLKIAAVCCAALLPFQLLFTDETPKLAVFMAFQFLNGICAASAFSLFCSKLNNIERLAGLVLIILYYSLYYTIYRAFPLVQAFYKSWGGIIVMAFYLVVVFTLARKTHNAAITDEEFSNIPQDGKGANIGIIIVLHIVYYSIMSMINYIEASENIVFSLPYGLGQLTSLVLIFFIMLLLNRNPLYIWLMFLVFTLAGLSIVNYNSEAAHFSGSIVYGLGDGLGYIVIYYLCSGAIKKSKSLKMYRLFCVILFIEYFFISGILSRVFHVFEGSTHTVALGIVLVLCSFCFLIMPYLQKKLFAVDWTDGVYLKDMEEYTQGLAETKAVNIKKHLDLTEREQEIFTMLLKGMSAKEIGYTLRISVPTVYFHRNNLYRKLDVQGNSELFSKYGSINSKN